MSLLTNPLRTHLEVVIIQAGKRPTYSEIEGALHAFYQLDPHESVIEDMEEGHELVTEAHSEFVRRGLVKAGE